jgi:uncharacterized protein
MGEPEEGERDLDRLLAELRPRLDGRAFVFCTLPAAELVEVADLAPVTVVAEEEGLTVVVEPRRAEEAGLSFSGRFARITLQVHSSLEAVGLTAAVAGRLADRGIGANVVAGFFHDHLFVPWERREEAVAVLRGSER